MKFHVKTILIAGVALLSLAACAFFIYNYYVPYVISQSITSDDEDSSILITKKIKNKIEKVKVPANQMSERIVQAIHKSDIKPDQLFKEIDKIKEAQLYSFLDELKNKPIEDPDEAFDLLKKHFPVSFDVEPFRETFRKNFSLKRMRKAVSYLDTYTSEGSIDFKTAKSVFKNILKTKEAELQKKKFSQ